MPKKYRSKIMASIHEGVSDLYLVGGVDKKTMREFDALCLTPVLDMTRRKFARCASGRTRAKRSLRLI